MLSCPQCGGNVAADSTRCRYCEAHLLLEACPKCLARVFHGHKHCPHCGVNTAAAALGETTNRVCPRCEQALAVREIAEVRLTECPGCHGVFIDKAAIEHILADRQQARAESVVGAYRGTPRVADTAKPGGKLYIKCPQCRTIMNRKLFARGAGVIVDVCKGHGTWFDPGELPVVVEFVMNGGLEQAEKKEIADQRDAANRAKAEARAMQASASMVHHVPRTKADTGAALIDLLFSIWR
jgi:Zn-finger nucleic acid-binding protein